MKIGIDYHERCSCGGEITVQSALRETVISLVREWRQNHVCPERRRLSQPDLRILLTEKEATNEIS